VLRAVPVLALQAGACCRVDVLDAARLSPEAVIDAPDALEVRAVLATLAETGKALLAGAPRRLPRPVIAAGLQQFSHGETWRTCWGAAARGALAHHRVDVGSAIASRSRSRRHGGASEGLY